jgi:hypothetical protein
MPDADWFKTMYQPVHPTTAPARDVGRVLTLHRNGHEATLDLRTVPGWGHELRPPPRGVWVLLLSVDGEWRLRGCSGAIRRLSCWTRLGRRC